MKRNLIIEIISSLLILLFVYTAVSKFIDFNGFTGEMNNQPFPSWMTPYLTWSIPSIEILISLTLIFQNTRKVGLYASLILMSMFTIYTASILLHFFDRVPCSCGGVIKQLTWNQHLFFNLFFVGISIVGIWLTKKSEKKEQAEIEQIIFT